MRSNNFPTCHSVARLGAMLTFLLTLSVGCTSQEKQISLCIDHSEVETGSELPATEVQSQILEARKRDVFYKCMVDAGYRPNPDFQAIMLKRADEVVAKYGIEATQATSLEMARNIYSKCMYKPDDCPGVPFWVKR